MQEIGLQSRYIVALLRLDLEKTVHPLKACPLTSCCVCVCMCLFFPVVYSALFRQTAVPAG